MPRKPRTLSSRLSARHGSARSRRRLFVEQLEVRQLLAIDAVLVRDINNGGDSVPDRFAEYDSYTYFRADDGLTGLELWRTDGVTASLFADLHPTSNSDPNFLTVANNKLFFTATTPTTSREVWATDGISPPQVFDVRAGSGTSLPESLTAFNGELYFVADNGTGRGIWHTNGIAAASLVAGTAGLNPTEMVVSGGKLYFAATPTAAPSFSRLYSYDGIGSLQVLSISSGSGSYVPKFLVEFNGTVYFSGARSTPLTGDEPFKVTGATTVDIVTNINPGAPASAPDKFTVVGTNLFFRANDGVATNLWRTYSGGTQKVADPIGVTVPVSSSFASVGNLLYFVGTSAGSTGIFTSDGTTISSLPLTNGMSPAQLTNVDGQLYFVGTKAGIGREIWYLNGPTPILVKDIMLGAGSSLPSGLKAVSSAVYFTADDGVNGSELWIAKDFPSNPSHSLSQDVGGNLVIADNFNGDDDITILSDGLGGWTITGAGANFGITGTVPAGIIASGNTIQIPASTAAAFNKIIFNTNEGNDKLTVDLAAGDAIPSAGIDFNGGNPTTIPGDKLVITGGSPGAVAYSYTNANSGSVGMSNYGTVNYTGLEPVLTDFGTAPTTSVFNLPAGSDVAFLEDDAAGNNMSRLRSSPATFEATTFTHPTDSLTINGGAGDSLAIMLVDSLTTANLVVTGMASISVGNVVTAGDVSLTAIGAIIEDVPDVEVDITASVIALVAGTGVATNGDPLETMVTNLNWSSGTGGAFVANTGALTIGPLAAFGSAITGGSGSGAATIGATSPLTVSSNVIMGGAVSLTAGETATDDVDNLTINAGVTVQSTGINVTLNAGDNLTVSSSASILAATTVTFNIDSGDLDATGESLLINSGAFIAAPGGATFNGGAQADILTFAPQSGTAIVVNGNAPVVSPGDLLNLDLTGATGTALTIDGISDGTFTFTNRSSVEYNSIEDVNSTSGCYDLTLNMATFGASGDFTVRRSAPSVGTKLEVVNNAGPSVVFTADLADIAELKVNGTANADALTVDDVNGMVSFDPLCIPTTIFPDNANSAGVARLYFDGAGGVNVLNFQLAESGTAQIYAIGNGAAPGTGDGEILTTNAAGRNLVTYFRNIGPAGSVNRAGTGAAPGALTILGDANGNTLTTTAAAGLTTVNPGTYTPFTFSPGSNYSQLDLQGVSGSDTYNINGAGAAGLDNLLIPAVVTDSSGNDSLFVNDSADTTGDTVTITQSGIDGLNPLFGNEISYTGIEILDVTGTSVGDSLTTSLGGAVASPTNFNGLVTVNVRGNGGNDDLFLHVADSLTNATLDVVNLFGDDGGDNFGSAAELIHPVLATGQTQIMINGDANAKTTGPVNPGTDAVVTGPDQLFLDLTTTDSGATVNAIVIADTNGGYADAANTVSFQYNGIEDIDLYDDGVLTNTAIGDFYLRATDGPDYILFMSAAQVNPTFRIRVGNRYYPTSGQYGPYTTGSSHLFVYGRGGNDTISMYNTRLNAAFFGEEGADILTGGYGNDLLVGGAGNDRLNGGTVGGNDTIWGDTFNPATDDPAVASQAATFAGQDNDQINTYGGNDTVYGQGGIDIINTGQGNDYINGGDGNDQLDGQGGDDRIYGGAGNDVMNGSDGNDIVAGSVGKDTVNGGNGNDILIGGLGLDIVTGSAGGDALVGDESNGSGSQSLATGDAADAALMALMTAWGPAPLLGSLGAFNSSGPDGSVDTLYGNAGADAYFGLGLLFDKAPDRNAPGYGPDLN